MKAAVITRKASKQELKQAFKAQPEAIIDHTYQNRSIAKMLASALQVEGEDFKEHVESYLEAINKLPADTRRALKYAFIFSRKAPHQEREDLYQELAIKLLELRPSDDKLAYAVARCDWKDWWKAFKLRSNYNWESIERLGDAEDGQDYGQEAIDRQVYHSALLDGQIEIERKTDAKILWNLLPKQIQAIVNKRLEGHALTGAERVAMCRYMKAHSGILAEYR
ncbi:MAG: hypothetical protein PHW33_01735 [Candidatus Portnoybacteria bacterium]|nr:hypothetical protein [Candidatus Portnoybacteria bacterium]